MTDEQLTLLQVLDTRIAALQNHIDNELRLIRVALADMDKLPARYKDESQLELEYLRDHYEASHE